MPLATLDGSPMPAGSALRRPLALLGAVLALALVLAATAVPASARMESTKISRHLCKTVHGGRFVDIPGFPGEKIDRRLLADIRWMRRNFDIFITDGYSTAPYHAPNGEHPIGLALDIVPYKERGGNWRKIARLARWAEPDQNEPRMPFRWVGWNGDAGHGRGDHLHLSYMHSPTEPRNPARVVYTRNCPTRNRDKTGDASYKSDGSGIAPRVGRLADVVIERH